MANPSRRQRRRLRQSNSEVLTEASITRVAANEMVTIEIVGGCPGSTATVLIGGTRSGEVRLDTWGTGRVHVVASQEDEQIDVIIGDRVLLSGRVPDVPASGRSRS